jgi:6-pyruvoyltetrahydropterin/6-carboxytetrahydropterin synthase
MLIIKETKFFASHRNQELADKCINLHGHKYEVKLAYRLPRTTGGITTLFSELEDQFMSVISKYDHAALWDKNDPLYQHIVKGGFDLKAVVFDGPTSVENLCFKLFGEVYALNPNLIWIEVKETTTSTIHYNYDDYVMDQLTFSKNRFLNTAQ